MTPLLDRPTSNGTAAAPVADATCPLRAGDGCRMCVPGATGPWDCGLVFLVRSDPDLSAGVSPH
jgi:hypothetical protein